MTELVPQDKALASIRAVAESDDMLQQLEFAAAGTKLDPRRLARILITELRMKPDLLQCSPRSLFGALMECAQLGLFPGAMGLAYIIRYGNKAQLQVGYRGLVQLAYRSQLVADVQAEVVYEKDDFTYQYGTDGFLRHVPVEMDEKGERTHAYAVIRTNTGGKIFRVMDIWEIDRIRKKYSKATRGDAPWITEYDEMACKTVLKRTVKRSPISVELQQAVTLDDAAEQRRDQNLGAQVTMPELPEVSGGEPEEPGDED